MNSYDEIYLARAQEKIGSMLEYAVYDLQLDIEAYWNKFLKSDISHEFSVGNPKYVAGKSGIELCLDVLDYDKIPVFPKFRLNRAPEYWAGWAIAYYQWRSGLNFREINEYASIKNVLDMYLQYHERDIRDFYDAVEETKNR